MCGVEIEKTDFEDLSIGVINCIFLVFLYNLIQGF